ncbi:MAG: electron transfer flavoprotein beta subunit/FixA family protein [ANME-2 cluster archaeon]|nr:MAG: electron transfer flavoprotein beta subunit/FixA family protein [ANME-2 cluster archaeon]
MIVEIVVCVKQIFDLNQIKEDAATKRPVTEGVTRKISDFDKNALEEALRLKEKHGGKVVVLVSGTKEAAKEALAMGADEAIVYLTETDSLGTASLLAGIIQPMKFDLILCGEASIDEYAFQVGPRLAEALGIPVLTYARKIEVNNGTIIAERELENRYEVVKAHLPVLVTVNKAINEPRIPTLLQIVGASKKKITELSPEKTEIGVETVNIEAIEMKRKEIILENIEKLAGVILSEK